MNETSSQTATQLARVRSITQRGCLEHNLANLGLIMFVH